MPARAAQAQPQNRPAQARTGGPIGTDTSPQLFAVMCALYAAGFPAEPSVSSSIPGFAALQTRLLALDGSATQAMRKYYREHVLADAGATMSRYVTFALTSGPPPKFESALAEADLPPDVLVLEGFRDVLVNFYAEAGIEKAWQQFEPTYRNRVMELASPVGRIAVLETGYLREVLGSSGRTFTAVSEPLVGTRTNVRNFGDHYVIVVGPSSGSLAQIQHAFLHFLLDPLPLRYSAEIYPAAPLLKTVAARAPQLPLQLRDDFTAFFTECLVRATELRLRRLPPAGQAEEIDNAESQGYVLLRPLVAALARFEASEPSITLYFPELIRSMNVAAEQKRVQTLTFAAGSSSPISQPAEAVRASAQPMLRPDLQAALDEGQRLIAAQDVPGASAAFERVLQGVPGQPRALYGLAVAALLQGDMMRGRTLFEQVIAAPSSAAQAAAPDAVALAWSHVYLGRIHDLQDERPLAVEQYRAALEVGDAPDTARAAAQRGLEQQYQPPAHTAPPAK